MKPFTNSSKVNEKKVIHNGERIASQAKMDNFVERFNQQMRKRDFDSMGSISLNTGVDSQIPVLNDKEFEQVNIQAIKDGWILTKYEDNYQTITYKLTKIK